ncbi:MAG: IclR family transcriptional regulator [Clostridium sp.]|uniref:IclR family transcriptional regulator n=1 Tax=Clostridium sp. TaxID=1506 RepID=UPI00304B314A
MEDNIVVDSKNPIQVVDRIFQVIETMSVVGDVGLVELSNILGLHKSTTHRLLNSLVHMKYVKQDENTGKYLLTFRFLEISNRILSRTDIFSLAHPYLEKLSMKTGETIHLVQREGTQAMYIDKVESNANSIRMCSKVGSVIPLYCSGVGKAILAAMSDEEVKKIWEQSKINKLTPYTITTFKELLECIEEVRRNGYATDDEENEEGVRCIAACILDYKGNARYAFSLSAPKIRMGNDRIKELATYVLQLKEELSKEFGYCEI